MAVLRECLRSPYRHPTGFVRGLSRILGIKVTINPSMVYWRIRGLVEDHTLLDLRLRLEEKVVASADSTGLKVGNYGEWMSEQVEETAWRHQPHHSGRRNQERGDFKATSEEVSDS